MRRFNIGVEGVSEMIAQAYSMAVLSNWFESKEERTFVVKLTDYYLYLINHGYKRTLEESEGNRKAYEVISGLEKNNISLERQEIDEIITKSYCPLMNIVGNLLMKQGALLFNNKVGYVKFNIEIAIPEVLKEFIGYRICGSIDATEDVSSFVELNKLDSFHFLVNDKAVISAICDRKDFSMKRLLSTEFTDFEDVVKSGMSYIILSSRSIKGKVVCDV